ncbi:MAG: ribonucleoside-diphosphate reductase subunit alpha [Gammaproteobacteria bacterium]|nr:ribonucleoside-diphosphate reductase subunit alpha [Gammaproteobacteria bacterium]
MDTNQKDLGLGVVNVKNDDAVSSIATLSEVDLMAPGKYRVVRRNGSITNFDLSKITVAMTKAFLAVEGSQAAASSRIHKIVEDLSKDVHQALTRNIPDGGTFHIEDIQDQVELALMRSSEHKVARSYVLYREEQSRKRIDQESKQSTPEGEKGLNATYNNINVTNKNGEIQPLDLKRLNEVVAEACSEIQDVSKEPVISELQKNIYDGVSVDDLATALTMSSRVLIEEEPNYTYVSARLLLDSLRREALSFVLEKDVEATSKQMEEFYKDYFKLYIKKACNLNLLSSEIMDSYDLEILSESLIPDRDMKFTYLGLQTLYDRYFIHSDGTRFELPQAFFMRVAMGLACNEKEKENKAIEFYKLLSSFNFMSSTPTLFNSGTLRPQLSSCYLSTIPDDLRGIFGSITDDALLSKFAGGLGNDWSRVRGMGTHIKGTNGKSQGVVPFLKVANDTAVAVNQGGKRKGAMCAYLETWHLDIEEFLDLRKNTGDDRRRTHDMNTANWIPDIFMKRVVEEGKWTLFSPHETEDLHDLYGENFEKRYIEYEKLAKEGKVKYFKEVNAVDLWKKMLGMLFETGHPWITFKDPCNIRSPQGHSGVVHSSNLCTEITLNTSDDEIAVCNLGSVNLASHVDENGLIKDKLEDTIMTAMRMLDNVIDYNYYSVEKAKNSNLKHRPVGLGIMGFQDALYKLNIPYASEKAVEFADESMELVSYFAIKASTDLAEERGKYESFDGSLWSQGIMPVDSIGLLEESRSKYVAVDRTAKLDWDKLRERVKTVGMRNSNTLAIAPTATISNITGVTQSIEPTYQNLYVKSNLSGEFTVINLHLVNRLKELGLWDKVMVNDLKYYDGSISSISRITDEIKSIFSTAFELDARWLIEAASRRQKWIDQSQSLNLYMSEPSGPKLDNLYKLAWVRGLKTTYYLRTMGATHVEKSTLNDNKLNAVAENNEPQESKNVCSILDPDCEACQ